MVAYRRDEIISASDVARGFSAVLNDLIKNSKDKFAISKNNKLEAVLLPIDEYERMKEVMDVIEHIEIHNIVKKREKSPKSKYISLEESAKKHGIDLNDI